MSLVSRFKTDEGIISGTLIEAFDYCKKNCLSVRCLDFYNSISQNEVFLKCPRGFSVYRCDDGTIYTCMLEKNTCNGQLIHSINEANKYNPVLSEKQLIAIIEEDRKNHDYIDNLSHEVKQLIAQIKEHCDIILHTLSLDNEDEPISGKEVNDLADHIRSILVSASIISGRYASIDFEKNSLGAAINKTVSECVVYKKFDKMRKIFTNYQKRGIPITISGNSFDRIEAYSLFEMIPLLIIENAVKYTYDDRNSVDIQFNKNEKNELIVVVSSFGPYCDKEELTHIFEKGVRGSNAKKICEGSGIGLYFVKMLCDVHDIEITATSGENRINISGMEYAVFEIQLVFRNLIE